MVHHSIAVVITSFLTNFLELREGEVRRTSLLGRVNKGTKNPAPYGAGSSESGASMLLRFGLLSLIAKLTPAKPNAVVDDLHRVVRLLVGLTKIVIALETQTPIAGDFPAAAVIVTREGAGVYTPVSQGSHLLGSCRWLWGSAPAFTLHTRLYHGCLRVSTGFCAFP